MLTHQNSWFFPGGLWQDADLQRVKASPLHYRPTPFSAKDCARPSVYTLRGPRRVGKTIGIKLLIADLIEQQGWAPRSIVWTTFDTIRTLSQAESHLLELVAQTQPKLLCIDEITAVVGWQRVIKKLKDQGPLAKTCVIVTGSSAFDLKSGAERMAGRRGEAVSPDRVLLPMSFSAFVEQFRHNKAKDSLPALAKLYLEVGGFPFRVEGALSARTQGARPWDALLDFQIFDDVMFYEIGRRRLDRSIAIEMIGRLASIATGSSSYDGFAKPLAATKDTARKYLDALGDAFLLTTYSSYDTGRGRVAPKKEKKFLWIDPSLTYMAHWLRQTSEPLAALRAETVVGAELLRRHELRLWEGLSSPRSVFTWKASSGKDVDFLIVDKALGLRHPVEVKYQQSISEWDFKVMEKSFAAGTLVTAETALRGASAHALPLAEFLMGGR